MITRIALSSLLLFAGVFNSAAQEITDDQIRDVINRVARNQLRPLADGEYPAGVTSIEQARAAKRPEGITWSYPWGVTLFGLMRASDATGDKQFEKFVFKHDDICARYYVWLSGLTTNSITDTNATGIRAFTRTSRVNGLIGLGSLDSCGAMGNQLLEAMLRQHIPLKNSGTTPPDADAKGASRLMTKTPSAGNGAADSPLPIAANRIANWITRQQDRLPDGTLWRSRSQGGTVWPDDLYMACPFIVRWAKLTGDSRHLDDAAEQVIHQAALTQDKDGLFFHGYYVSTNQHANFKWGRGNGWVTVATVEILSALPENHPRREQLLTILRKQIDGIKPLQAPSGMWRQVLDKPDLWEETSCTAMFAYGIARAVNRGWIDPSNMAIARKAFAGISKNVTDKGVVNETCEGTNINASLDYYVKRGRPSNDHHGMGPVLLAGSEILAGKKR